MINKLQKETSIGGPLGTLGKHIFTLPVNLYFRWSQRRNFIKLVENSKFNCGTLA